jgi:hypothetical protein
MSVNLPPILHNNRLNSIINVSDFNYQNNLISYLNADSRYTLSSIYKTALSSINSAISNLQNTDISLQNQINSLNYDAWTKIITQATSLSGSNNFIASTFSGDVTLNNGADIQLNSGMINQGTGASINQMGRTNFKNTITCGNLSQTSGSTTLKDVNCNVLTQPTNAYITQQGTSVVANNLRTTYITDLVVSNSISLPSTVVLPSTTYTGDIIMNDSRVVQNDTTGTKQNQFINTDFISDVYVDGNFSMTNLTKTCTLKNVNCDGDSIFNGSISQSTGANSFGDSTFTNLTCNNLIPLEKTNTIRRMFI